MRIFFKAHIPDSVIKITVIGSSLALSLFTLYSSTPLTNPYILHSSQQETDTVTDAYEFLSINDVVVQANNSEVVNNLSDTTSYESTTSQTSTIQPSETTVTSTTIQQKKNTASSTTSILTTTTTSIQENSCPRTTQNCVPCQQGEVYCRFEPGQTSGYLGWACQNNNPGNVKYSTYRISLIQQMGGNPPCGQKGGFMVFSTYDSGRNSVKAYIRAINAGKHSAYPTCGNCTLREFFEKYADNPLYANKIAQKMGGDVTPDTLLNVVVANRLDDFLNAIQQSEGFFTQ